MSAVLWVGITSAGVLWLTLSMHRDYNRIRAELKSEEARRHLPHMLFAVRLMYLLLAADVGMLIQAGYRALHP